jgi:hypothetical protein
MLQKNLVLYKKDWLMLVRRLSIVPRVGLKLLVENMKRKLGYANC